VKGITKETEKLIVDCMHDIKLAAVRYLSSLDNEASALEDRSFERLNEVTEEKRQLHAIFLANEERLRGYCPGANSVSDVVIMIPATSGARDMVERIRKEINEILADVAKAQEENLVMLSAYKKVVDGVVADLSASEDRPAYTHQG